MNKFSKVFLLSSSVLFLVSCGNGDKKNESDAQNDASKILQATGNNALANAQQSSNEKMKERRAKGDTLAMPYAELQKYLPGSIDGYKAGNPDGATVNMMKMSYSSADIKFTKDNGDWVRVAILDYNQANGLYNSATALWAMGMSVDTPEEKADGIKLDNTVGGWEVYKKKTKNAEITLGVGSRFLVTVEANNQSDVDMVKTIAKSIDLSKLAAL